MSRSIHTTKKDLKRERYFAASDGVPPLTDATELETQHFKKVLYKDNERWKRAAQRKKTPIVGKFKLSEGKLVFKRVKMRADKPEDPPTQSP
jgi:hypothetical protein